MHKTSILNRLLRHPIVAAGVVFLAVMTTASVSIALPRDGFLSPVWLANACVLSALLLSPVRRWPALVLSGVCGNVAAELLGHIPLAQGAGLVLCNVLEYVVSAIVLRQSLKQGPDFSRARDLSVLAVTVLMISGFTALISSTVLFLTTGAPFLDSVRTWTLAHSLGLLTITPCLLIVRKPNWRMVSDVRLWRPIGAATLLVVTTLAVFAQSRFPVLFLIPPALLLVSIELETFGAAAGVLTVEIIAIGSLFAGTGPMTLVHGGSMEKAAVMQVFLLASLLSSLPVAALNVRRRETMAALSRNEARYRRLADNASDIVSESDLLGRFTYVSPALRAITGYSEDEVLGRSALELVHPDDRERVKQEIKASLACVSGLRIEHRHICKDGRVIWVESRPTLVRTAEGAPFAVTDMLRDVTMRKELELNLIAARRLAEASAEAKSEFLATMSHELRTPLTSILGFHSMLQNDDTLSGLSRRSVERIGGSSQALLAIVNDILDFSKLEAGQVEIELRPTAISAMMQEALDMLAPQAAAKGLQLRYAEAGLPPSGMIDPTRVRQLLTNMIGNAVKFTEAGSVTLSVAYHAFSERLRCEIIDTGAGISDAGLQRLFQRFSQVDASTTRVHGGTGLGLAICKGLADAMGGEIGANSVVRQGSTFWFDLPCKLAVTPQSTYSAISKADADLSGLRVLVADDNPINRELVRLMLTPSGVHLTEAASGEEAISLAQEAPFDIILMDVRMPGIDGHAAAHAIRSGNGPNDMVPILAFTADVLLGPEGQATQFDDFIAKPIVPAAMIATIARWATDEASMLETAHG